MGTTSSLDCVVIGPSNRDLRFLLRQRGIGNTIKNLGRDFLAISLLEKREDLREKIFLEDQWLDVLAATSLARSQGRPARAAYTLSEVPNLATFYLADHLAARGFAVELVNSFEFELEKLADLLRGDGPGVVAITTTFYYTLLPIVEIVQFIRRCNARTKIVVGGPAMINVSRDNPPEVVPTVLEKLGADIYIIENQGEATLTRVVDAVKHGRSLSGVPNLYVRDGGRFVATSTEREDNDLDATSTDWSRFSAADLGATVQLRTARGCAYRCSFCDYPSRNNNSLDEMSIDRVERQLMQLHAMGVRQIAFVDDTFNIPDKRFVELLKMMVRNKFEFRWHAYFRCGRQREESTWPLMRESGCTSVFLGIESANDQILRNMNKRESIDTYRRGIGRLHEQGIVTVAGFITGFPGETWETVEETIRFVNDLAPTYFRLAPWYYHHGTPIKRDAEKHIVSGGGWNWTHATMDTRTAFDMTDQFYFAVTNSQWMPGKNWTFWGIPYLLGKGASADQLLEMHKVLRKGFDLNYVAESKQPEVLALRRAMGEKFADFARSLALAPPKYVADGAASPLDDDAHLREVNRVFTEILQVSSYQGATDARTDLAPAHEAPPAAPAAPRADLIQLRANG